MGTLQRSDRVNAIGTDWTQIGPRGHAVQFYEHDDALAQLLAAYVGTALVKGDAAIVIATKKHREDLRLSLAEHGMNLAVPEALGRYEALDATETLSLITDHDGWPDRARFTRVVGAMIERLVGTVRKD